MPILKKEQCGHTYDGGVQLWMHGLLANMGGGIPNHDDSDDDAADMPTLSDTSSDAGDEQHIDRLDEDADESDDDNVGLLTAMNLLAQNFQEGTNAWDPQVDGDILPFLTKSAVGSNPDDATKDLSNAQAYKAVGGRKLAKPPSTPKPDTTSHLWDPH